MKTREQWQAETKVIRDMAETIWKASIPFEEDHFNAGVGGSGHFCAVKDAHSNQFGLWEQQLMRTYGEMIDMAIDRDLEDEDYPTVKEVAAE